MFNAKQYFNQRYASGRGSDIDNYPNELRRVFKLEEVKKVKTMEIQSVLDIGCGDFITSGRLMKLFPNATYLGLDISEVIIEKNRKKKLGNRFKFKPINNCRFNYPSDLVLCLDILFHVIDDVDYQDMLQSLKISWRKYLFISSYTPEAVKMRARLPYVKKRLFNPNYFSNDYYKINIPLYGMNPRGACVLYKFEKKWICPICKFQGQFTIFRKEDKWHVENKWCCPQCLSKNQHRLIWLVYQKLQNEPIGRKILHCSPNRALKEKFSKDFDYLSIDFPLRKGSSGIVKADLKQDLRHTCFKDEYFDIIICSNVLDQIEEDEKAIKELYRILKPGGIAFVVIPIYSGEKTKKLLKPVLNHWWRCGYDYFDKLRKAGFSVELIKYDQFDNWEELGLDGAVLALCRKKRKARKD